jgi:hypothetical protein
MKLKRSKRLANKRARKRHTIERMDNNQTTERLDDKKAEEIRQRLIRITGRLDTLVGLAGIVFALLIGDVVSVLCEQFQFGGISSAIAATVAGVLFLYWWWKRYHLKFS